MAKRKEDVSFRNAGRWLASEHVIGVVANVFGMELGRLLERGYGCAVRGVAARMLIRYAGLSQRDVADVLKMGSGSAVCRSLKRLDLQMSRDADLSAHHAAIRTALDKCLMNSSKAT